MLRQQTRAADLLRQPSQHCSSCGVAKESGDGASASGDWHNILKNLLRLPTPVGVEQSLTMVCKYPSGSR